MQNILNKSYLISRPFNNHQLKIEDLVKYKLTPKHHIKVVNKEIYLSDKFFIAENKVPRVIAYIQDDNNKYLICSYFQSKSQGLYRLLKAYKYRLDENGIEKPAWNDKGYSEESLMLPLELQFFISEQIKENITISNKMEGIQVFYGTTLESGNDTIYKNSVDVDPILIPGNIYTHDKTKISPKDISVEKNASPNFQRTIFTWRFDAAIYGKITARVFKSSNGKFIYLFLTDSLNRSWIGGIDNNSEVTTLGIRRKWVDMGCLGTPAFEYQNGFANGKYKYDQTGGYGNRDLMYKDIYVDMYKNYLSHIPLIKEFENWNN